jgi:hypothetical protein
MLEIRIQGRVIAGGVFFLPVAILIVVGMWIQEKLTVVNKQWQPRL